MLGFQEESLPFEYSINFFHENGKKLPPIGDIIYPITKAQDSIFETSIHYPLKKLMETPKDLKLGRSDVISVFVDDGGICPKLDEVAKDKNNESGIKDSKAKIPLYNLS